MRNGVAVAEAVEVEVAEAEISAPATSQFSSCISMGQGHSYLRHASLLIQILILQTRKPRLSMVK